MELNFFKTKETKEERDTRETILKNRNDAYVLYVSQQSGWTLTEAKKKMDALKEKGVDYRYYVKRRLWCKSGEKLEKSIQSIVRVRRGEKRKQREYIRYISRESKWSRKEIKKKILEANLHTGCSFRDYYQFEFWNKTTEQQKEYYTKGVVEQLLMKYNNNLQEIRILKNKNLFAKKYADLFHRQWFINRKLSFDDFLEKTKNIEEFISKPAFGTHGAGVEKYSIPESTAEKKALYEKLMDKPKSQCEEFIKQHHAIAEFCPTSVNTIRMMTILDKGVCHYMYSVIRLGTGGLVDGFDAGGIFAPIDVQTGITCTDALDLDKKSYPLHPVSGKKTKDFQIPHWDMVLKITEAAAKRLEGVHMVGWDLAITEDGVCLIEGNSEANYQFAQLPYIQQGLGVKYKFESFL